MREIEFRAQCLESNGNFEKGDWVYGHYYYDWENRTGVIVTRIPAESGGVGNGLVVVQIPVDYQTRCQFTGLHDKNKKKIYEGDILEWKSEDGEGELYEVVWIEKQACFGTKIVINKPIFAHFNTGYLEDHEPYQDEEVVGNIYQNPELLKK